MKQNKGRHISWKTGRQDAYALLLALQAFVNNELTSNKNRYWLEKNIKFHWEECNLWISETTLQALASLIGEYEQKNDKGQKNKEKIRNAIKCLEQLNILDDKREVTNSQTRTGSKKWRFVLKLISIDKQQNMAWLFGNNNGEGEWDKRREMQQPLAKTQKQINNKLYLQSCIDDNNCSDQVEGIIEMNSTNKFLNKDAIVSNKLAQKFKAISSNEREASRKRGINLPRSNNVIWGRKSLVTMMNSQLIDFNEPSIFSLSGPPGYGKTEAAICIAWEALNLNYFEDIIYIKARQTELIEDSIAPDIKDETLGWEEFRDQMAEQLSNCPIGQIQQKLREEARLIIIDNAETAKAEEIVARLHPMLNPSRVLLTSRVNYNEPRFIKTIEIPGLDEAGTINLLQYEAERTGINSLLNLIETKYKKIHELSCGAPLALHFIIGRLRSERNIDSILVDLEEADKNVSSFYEFTLKLAWENIDEIAKKILIYIAKFNNSVCGYEVQALLDPLDSFLKEHIRQLKRWYLLQEESEQDLRYNLHPWIRGAIRGGLVQEWKKPLIEELKQIISLKNL